MADSSKLFAAERVFASFIKSNDPLGLFAASDCDALGNAIDDTLMPLTFPPLEALPCANRCPNSARIPCGRCKLVSYCSQVRSGLVCLFPMTYILAVSCRNVKENIGVFINEVRSYFQHTIGS